jgi:DNA polymerase-3 subunit delta
MPSATPSAVRRQIAQRTPDPLYLIVGDDDAEMARLATDVTTIVEDELRAFNVTRIYATDRGVNAISIVETARMLPMMSAHRVVVVLRAERLLRPGRGARGEDETEPGAGGDTLEAYLKDPPPETVLVLVASDVDRSRRLYKILQRHATIVECWGLKGSKDARIDLRQAARHAETLVAKAVQEAGQQIEPAAARLIAARAGLDIRRLRGDLDRLLLYAAGKSRITIADAREVVGAATSQDDWAVTNAIQRGDVAEALRQLALALDSGAIPYMVLGQLAWFVRERLASDFRRVQSALDALFRTDQDLKTSGGDPRVLLERLVVELCGKARAPLLAPRP